MSNDTPELVSLTLLFIQRQALARRVDEWLAEHPAELDKSTANIISAMQQVGMTIELPPNQQQRSCPGDGEPLSDAEQAAYEFVHSLVSGKIIDGFNGSAPYWHGWALRTAFEEGVAYGRATIVQS